MFQKQTIVTQLFMVKGGKLGCAAFPQILPLLGAPK